MNNLEIQNNEDRNAYIKDLECRVSYCERVAKEYEMMFKQIQMEMNALADRQGNIQQVYDYMTRIGSEIAVKNPHKTTFLSPIKKALPMDKAHRLELMSEFEFKVGDVVFYARENTNEISEHVITGIDIIERRPRYCLTDIFGYVDESKLFKIKEAAERQLCEWRRG